MSSQFAARPRPDRHEPDRTREPDAPAVATRTPSAVIALQRAAGNRATVAMLQRQGHGPVVKGASPSADGGATEKAAGGLRSTFLGDRDTFVNLWLTASLAALEGAPEAKDPESQRNWWVALCGNLLWAASSLLAPEAVLAIRVMSFAGAAVGSGVLAQDPETAPSGRENVSQMLTRTRDLMVQTSGPMLDRAVAECDAKQVADAEERRKVLWTQLFKTPYNESEPIRAEMSGKLKAALSQFLAQWHVWDDAIKKEAEAKGYTGGLPPGRLRNARRARRVRQGSEEGVDARAGSRHAGRQAAARPRGRETLLAAALALSDRTGSGSRPTCRWPKLKPCP